MFRIRILLFLVCLVLFAVRFRERYSDNLRITFFDVGQGDGALIEFPTGKTALVDAGGWFGKRTVGLSLGPELIRKSILTLDYCILTHPDSDHGEGFKDILPTFHPKEFWVPRFFITQNKRAPLLGTLLSQCEEFKIPVIPIEGGTVKTIAGVDLRVFIFPTSLLSDNNRSLVFELDYGNCEILFTADIEAPTEYRILNQFTPVDLLKVAHHGSKSSSTAPFLDLVKPQWALISSGRENRYGHPHPSVIANLRERSTTIFRTDFHGFVQFTFSKEGQVQCQSALGSCGTGVCR